MSSRDLKQIFCNGEFCIAAKSDFAYIALRNKIGKNGELTEQRAGLAHLTDEQ